MQMLAIIPIDFPTFATEHVHYFTQEAIIINEMYSNVYNVANLLVVQKAVGSQSKTTPNQPISLCKSKKPASLILFLKQKLKN